MVSSVEAKDTRKVNGMLEGEWWALVYLLLSAGVEGGKDKHKIVHDSNVEQNLHEERKLDTKQKVCSTYILRL